MRFMYTDQGNKIMVSNYTFTEDRCLKNEFPFNFVQPIDNITN